MGISYVCLGLQSNCEVTWSRRGWRQAIFFFFFRAFTETEERATPSSDSVSKTVGDVNAAGLAIQLFQTPHHLFSRRFPSIATFTV